MAKTGNDYILDHEKSAKDDCDVSSSEIDFFVENDSDSESVDP